MKGTLITLVAAIILGGAGFFAWKSFNTKPAPVAPQAAADTRGAYATSTYSVKYPADFTLDARYTYDQFGPKKLINGVKFIIPATMATGTNLSTDTGVSVEQLPRAKNCTADIYLVANVTAYTVSSGGTDYSFASSSGAAAGNRYEEQVYALPNSSPCTAVRYFIHSGAIENYPAGAVREFDRAALVAEFDKIRSAVSFGL